MKPLCALVDIPPGSARNFSMGRTSVLVYRSRHDTVHAYINRCPHLGVPLNWDADRFMDNEGSFLRCATHGALFEPDTGHCILGPCRGEYLWPLDSALEAGAVLIDDADLPAGNPN